MAFNFEDRKNFLKRKINNLREKDLEYLIIKYPDEFIEEGLEFIDNQVSVDDAGRLDILFKTKLNEILVVEVKKGNLTRRDVGQVLEYFGAIKSHYPEKAVHPLLIASSIGPSFKITLDEYGIDYREIPLSKYIEIADKHGEEFDFGAVSIESAPSGQISDRKSDSNISDSNLLRISAGQDLRQVFLDAGDKSRNQRQSFMLAEMMYSDLSKIEPCLMQLHIKQFYVSFKKPKQLLFFLVRDGFLMVNVKLSERVLSNDLTDFIQNGFVELSECTYDFQKKPTNWAGLKISVSIMDNQAALNSVLEYFHKFIVNH